MRQVTRQRDAERSRSAIIDAAEALFAQKGYAATSMAEIASAAGMARATPGYFFGSKEALYQAVLRRAHQHRSEALAVACAPLHRWAADGHRDHRALREAIAAAVEGYTTFLQDRPAFARLIEWESLSGAPRLPAELSTSFSKAFRAVHAVRRERGLGDFEVPVVVVALVSMCFLPVAHANTFAAGGGIEPLAPAFRERYHAAVVECVYRMLASGGLDSRSEQQ